MTRSDVYGDMGRQILSSPRFEIGIPGVWQGHDAQLGCDVGLAAQKSAEEWYLSRPRDAAGAVRFQEQLCEARCGAMLPAAPQRLPVRGASAEVSGPG